MHGTTEGMANRWGRTWSHFKEAFGRPSKDKPNQLGAASSDATSASGVRSRITNLPTNGSSAQPSLAPGDPDNSHPFRWDGNKQQSSRAQSQNIWAGTDNRDSGYISQPQSTQSTPPNIPPNIPPTLSGRPRQSSQPQETHEGDSKHLKFVFTSQNTVPTSQPHQNHPYQIPATISEETIHNATETTWTNTRMAKGKSQQAPSAVNYASPTTNMTDEFQKYSEEYEAKRIVLLEFAASFNPKVTGVLGTNLTATGVGARKIRLLQGDRIGDLVINIQTEAALNPHQQNSATDAFANEQAKDNNLRLCPVTFKFSTGPLQPAYVSSLARATHEEPNPDFDGNDPKNFQQYQESQIGDSVSEARLSTSGTLGPRVVVGDKYCFITNWHLFGKKGDEYTPNDYPCTDDWKKKDILEKHELILVHPSQTDLKYAESKGEVEVGSTQCRELGKVIDFSGEMYVSRSSYPARSFGNLCRTEVVTDWALIEVGDKKHHCPNQMRQSPCGGREINEYANMSEVLGKRVVSTGRSSGSSMGMVSLAPETYEDRPNSVPRGTPTLEWFVERPPHMRKFDWVSKSIGIPGDSGACIIDYTSWKMIGQVWGRNIISGPEDEDRITYFTSAIDLFDDIERIHHIRPKLPGGQVSPSVTWDGAKNDEQPTLDESPRSNPSNEEEEDRRQIAGPTPQEGTREDRRRSVARGNTFETTNRRTRVIRGLRFWRRSSSRGPPPETMPSPDPAAA